jgi:protein-S-isoprenylcysteine O-methyltransferase Ste14
MLCAGVVMGTYGNREVNTMMHTAIINIPNKAASYKIIISVYVFVAAFSFGWGPVMWIYSRVMSIEYAC